MTENRPVDGWAVATLGLAGFFCLFTLGMSLTSGKYVFENITNIDALRHGYVYHIAVRLPRNATGSMFDYPTVTYPLPIIDDSDSGVNVVVANGNGSSARDRRAKRTFAILKTQPGENPFDLGPWNNWKSVMGNSVWEWMLPIKHSPCCRHDSNVSEYEFGPLIGKLKQRYNVPSKPKRRRSGESIEMRDAPSTDTQS